MSATSTLRKIDYSKEGECVKCKRLYHLTATGSIWFHCNGTRNSGRCSGAGLAPRARTVAQRVAEDDL